MTIIVEARGSELAAPLVSIVMPTFNRRQLIAESIQSVIDQTYPNWELIVVDDGSTDDSAACVEAFCDPRVVVLRQPRIGNVARLRNIGIGASRGDLFAFLDSDDLWLASKLEMQLRALAGKRKAWSYGAHALVDLAGRRKALRAGRFNAVSGRITEHLLADETGATVITWLVPRALLDETGGFDETLHLQEDLDLALRLAAAGDAVAIPRILALARDHPGRRTLNGADVHRQTAEVFEKAAMRLDDPYLTRLARQRQAGHLLRGGEGLLAQGRLLDGGRLIGQALIVGAGLRPSLRAVAAGLWQGLARR